MKKLSIIVPIYNEAATIHLILDKIKNVSLPNNIEKEIIIVDDCSTDNSKTKIEDYIEGNSELDIKFYQHDKNKGKGAALHTGIKNAVHAIYCIIKY